MADPATAQAVTIVVFGENQIEVPPEQGITLADVRSAFGFADRGILVVPTAGGGTRPVATLPDDEVPLVEGVEVEFVVYEDEAGREDGAIVQRLLALGAAGVIGADADPSTNEPYRVVPLKDGGFIVDRAGAYDPWAQPGQLTDACTARPYRLAFQPPAVGPLPEVIEANDDDPWGIIKSLAAAAR